MRYTSSQKVQREHTVSVNVIRELAITSSRTQFGRANAVAVIRFWQV